MAAEIAAAEGLTYVPPYDHPLVIAGQGTAGLEIAEDVPDAARVAWPPSPAKVGSDFSQSAGRLPATLRSSSPRPPR